MSRDNQFLAAAIAYARRGWRVLPLHVWEKRPRPRDWVNAASADETTVRAWWRDVPDGNVGVALGSESGLVAVDIDTEEGSEKFVTLSGGDLPDTCELTTGKGSRLLYGIPDALEFEPKTVPFSIPGPPDPETGLPTKIEILRFQGRGGQCVMPPSVHPSGRLYAWVEGRGLADLDPAPMPAWLIAAMTPPEPVHPTEPVWTGVTPAAGPREENFNFAADWWAHVLQPAGFTPSRPARGDRGSFRYCRPGKDDRSVSVTVGYYKAKDGTDALHCFSSSVYGLDAGKTYDKIGAFARLFFRGDFAAAARAAVAKGIIKARARAPRARVTFGSTVVGQAVEAESDDLDWLPAAWRDPALPGIGRLTKAEAERWLRRSDRVR